MRQFAAAVLAVPILLLVYFLAAVRRPAGRLVLLVGALGLGGIVWAGTLAAARTTADQPVAPTPMPVAAFSTIQVQAGLEAPVDLAFSTPMDEASARSALRVEPAVPVRVSFDTSGTRMSIAPSGHWSPATYYTLSIGQAARDRGGHQLSAPVETAFLTRPSTSVTLSATGESDGAVPLDTKFVLTVQGDVSADALSAALVVSPEVSGSLSVTGPDEPPVRGRLPVTQVAFTPSESLTAGRTYTVSLTGLVDTDGAAVVGPSELAVTTAAAPSVVRFRPLDKTASVPLVSPVSVRFSEPMDRPSTQAAFSVTVDGAAVKGRFDWAERGTVLVFKPAKPFDYSKTVVLSVAATARSARGVPLTAAASVRFTTVAKPAPKPAPKPRPAAKPKPVPIASGGSVASGTWAAVEAYYLRLLNCTRTGGWVTTSGSCQVGSNGTPPLVMSAGIQTRVARPYAKVLATTGACSHTADGTFAYRLARGGFSGYIWAGENVGCGNGDPYKAMLADHLFFQAEKSTNGGHYRNIMDPRFKVVGVGVWVYAGRCRLVTDFLDP